ncbi:MAG: hypothetical protein U1E96_08880 [Azonexus sp.]
MSLPADFARCPGQGCPSKMSCQRYLDHSGPADQVVMAAFNHRMDPGATACDSYIAVSATVSQPTER